MYPPIDDAGGLVAKLQEMAGSRKDDDVAKDPGPNEVGPTSESKEPGAQLVSLPFEEKDITQWWKEVEGAESRRKTRETSWDLLLDEYMPIVSASGVAETVKVQAHFRNVHTKLGNLWYRSPDVVCTPDSPGPGDDMSQPEMPIPGQPPQPPTQMADTVALKQAVLKKKMGRDGIKANRLMDEVIFDVLAWAGIGVVKEGYACTFKQVAQPKMVPGPINPDTPWAPAPMMPHPTETEMVPMPVHESYYARRVSPKKALWSKDLKSTRFDEDASWVGMDFFLTPKRAMKMLGLSKEEADKCSKDDRVHQFKDDGGDQGTAMVHGVEIWARACLFTDEVHPEAVCQLVLVHGIKDRPVVWRMSPWQEFDPATGKLTEDSYIGFPIKFLTIRDLADSCFPPSDSAFTNSEIKQLSTYRRQTIRIRDASIGKYLYDPDAFDEDDVEKLKNGDIGDFIAVQNSKLKDGVDKVFAATTKILGSADDQRGFMGIKQDMGETLGIGSNQSGVETDTVRTATESDRVAQAVQSRNDKELERVIDFYLDLVRGLDQLLMRYMTQDEYVEIGGEAAAGVLTKWNGKMISGRYLYDIAPDSQLRPDSAQDFMRTMQHYNLTAKDPMSNRAYLLKRMARQRGMDPKQAVLPPPPPPQPPKEPIKITLSLVVDDLENPKVQALLLAMGDNIAPTVQLAGHEQPQHGGPADQADPISQHMMSNSGEKQNAPGATNHRANEVK